MALWLTLTDALGFLGLAGTVIAIASALAAAIAFGIGTPDRGWIAAIGWLAGLLLSLGNCFTGNWTLLMFTLLSLPVSLAVTVIIAVLRTIPRRVTGVPILVSRPMEGATDA